MTVQVEYSSSKDPKSRMLTLLAIELYLVHKINNVVVAVLWVVECLALIPARASDPAFCSDIL